MAEPSRENNPPSARTCTAACRGVLDANGAIVEAQDTLLGWLGVAPSEVRECSFFVLVAAIFPDRASEIAALGESGDVFSELLLAPSGGAEQPGDWVRLEKTRTPTHTVVTVTPALPPSDQLSQYEWTAFLTSDSARRDLFVRLLRAESRLEDIVRRWPGILFSQRADLSFSFVSPQIQELTGHSADEWVAKPGLFWQAMHDADLEEFKSHIRECKSKPEGRNLTYRIRNHDTGRISYVMEHRTAQLSENGLVLGYEGVWLDVTRQVIAEKRLINAAWKETLAVLTMGLAHDFSNVMAGIHSLSESFLSGIEEDHPFKEGLNLIRHNTMQAIQLVQRILSLHQGKTGENNYHNLNEVATDVVDLIRKVVPRRIVVDSNLVEGSPPIYTDFVDFRQVIINLALNAVDAMPDTGSIAVTTGMHETIPEQSFMVGGPVRTPCVSLSLKDTGTGIPARLLRRIFDPFFTSKAMNKGSGLGLYNARLFVERHHGAISVETEEGTGTCFTIWLPQADFTEAEREEAAATEKPRLSLLLVGRPGEDLDGTAEALRSQGFHVVDAISPDNARECLSGGVYDFSGMILLTEAGECDILRIVPELLGLNPGMKTVIKPSGCHHDDLAADALAMADLVISSDHSPQQILEDLKTLFDVES